MPGRYIVTSKMNIDTPLFPVEELSSRFTTLESGRESPLYGKVSSLRRAGVYTGHDLLCTYKYQQHCWIPPIAKKNTKNMGPSRFELEIFAV
jgi:hypothetical protein